MINIEELKFNKKNEEYESGYRIVYFYPDGKYSIGEYSKTIEGFMIGFSLCDPILSDNDIPPFISNEDLLNRCLKSVKNATSCAIFKIDGALIQKLDNNSKLL